MSLAAEGLDFKTPFYQNIACEFLTLQVNVSVILPCISSGTGGLEANMSRLAVCCLTCWNLQLQSFNS